MFSADHHRLVVFGHDPTQKAEEINAAEQAVQTLREQRDQLIEEVIKAEKNLRSVFISGAETEAGLGHKLEGLINQIMSQIIISPGL